MLTPSSCPDADVLQRFLLGQTSDQESSQLEAHLSTCPNCVQTLHGLKAEDTVVEAMRVPPLRDDEEKVVEDLIKRMEGLRPRDGEAAPEAHVAIDFLAPAQVEGEL